MNIIYFFLPSLFYKKKRYNINNITISLFPPPFLPQKKTPPPTNAQRSCTDQKRTTQAKGSASESALQYSGRTQLHPPTSVPCWEEAP